jgi:hypothetical protein
MNRATPEMRSLAKDLIAHETSRNKNSKAKAPTAFHVAEKLRPQLANLMGDGGFQALLSRALVLAAAEVSWLAAVHVKADGTLDGLRGPSSTLDPSDFLEGKVVLLAQLLGLLVAFIGSTLTSHLVGEIWPQFHPTISASADRKVRIEKAKQGG